MVWTVLALALAELALRSTADGLAVECIHFGFDFKETSLDDVIVSMLFDFLQYLGETFKGLVEAENRPVRVIGFFGQLLVEFFWQSMLVILGWPILLHLFIEVFSEQS